MFIAFSSHPHCIVARLFVVVRVNASISADELDAAAIVVVIPRVDTHGDEPCPVVFN